MFRTNTCTINGGKIIKKKYFFFRWRMKEVNYACKSTKEDYIKK